MPCSCSWPGPSSSTLEDSPARRPGARGQGDRGRHGGSTKLAETSFEIDRASPGDLREQGKPSWPEIAGPGRRGRPSSSGPGRLRSRCGPRSITSWPPPPWSSSGQYRKALPLAREATRLDPRPTSGAGSPWGSATTDSTQDARSRRLLRNLHRPAARLPLRLVQPGRGPPPPRRLRPGPSRLRSSLQARPEVVRPPGRTGHRREPHGPTRRRHPRLRPGLRAGRHRHPALLPPGRGPVQARRRPGGPARPPGGVEARASGRSRLGRPRHESPARRSRRGPARPRPGPEDQPPIPRRPPGQGLRPGRATEQDRRRRGGARSGRDALPRLRSLAKRPRRDAGDPRPSRGRPRRRPRVALARHQPPDSLPGGRDLRGHLHGRARGQGRGLSTPLDRASQGLRLR